ncbi:response regulator [Novosphingobium sp. PS1R-30]|uniref:Response regulator n=1 Tax=Novosphingobium anseongense TaxID=3133436 RepID=A0ABU8RX72_9SPHN
MYELSGKRILVMEQQAMLAQFLTDMLGDLNCRVVGPATRVPQALALLVENDVEAAILNWELGDESSSVVAEELLRRGIPWAFASSRRTSDLARRYPDAPLLTKPFASAHVQRVLEQLLMPAIQ